VSERNNSHTVSLLTYSTEKISERSRKPLLNITSGELGTEADVAEDRLLKSFELGQQWNAIVLIDEADVFLAQRTVKDIKRNAFVSGFLRTMEWYSGILLLTTNRHEDFDEAFRSRIHISIPYAAADAKTRTAIWKNLLGAQDDIEHELDSQALIRVGEKYELNGRELKNLLSMSLAISKGNRTPLNEARIDSMYKLCNN
jgi:SpoVK/Ycf46/Vps4 family AAA+-type ATPase